MGGKAPGDSKVSEGNIFALFPGIDTTPFGDPEDRDSLSDDGWSAVPERTITDDTQALQLGSDVGDGVRSGRHSRLAWSGATRGTRPALAAIVAVLAGAGLGLVHSVLTSADRPASSNKPAKQLATLSPMQHQVSSGTTTGRTVRRSPVEHRAPTHQRARRPRRSSTHHAVNARTNRRPQASATSSQPVVTRTTSAVVPEPVASGSTDTPPASSSAPASSTTPVRPAGPTGRVSLIGAGTTPSG
jgi:hypothetical protein